MYEPSNVWRVDEFPLRSEPQMSQTHSWPAAGEFVRGAGIDQHEQV